MKKQSKMKGLDYDRDKDLIQIYNQPLVVSRAIQEIQGAAGVIIFDGKVSDEEIKFLKEWIQKHRPYLTKFPLDKLKTLFEGILADGVVSETERQDLFNFLCTIATGVRNNLAVDGIFSAKPQIEFRGKEFLFTGDMDFGSRSKAEKAVLERGGLLSKSCSKKTHYLVVGNLGSEAYKYGRYGTKIEKALELKKSRKSDIQIVREHNFVEAVMKSPSHPTYA
jgi:NAD-dependent DNA ligase